MSTSQGIVPCYKAIHVVGQTPQETDPEREVDMQEVYQACSGVNKAGWGQREAERRDRHNRSPFRMQLWSWGGLQACLDSGKAASGRAPDLGHGSEEVEDSFHSGLGCELSAASTPGSWRMERLGPRGGIWVGTTLSSKSALLNASPMRSVNKHLPEEGSFGGKTKLCARIGAG